MATQQVHFRMDEEDKKAVEELYQQMGMTASDAFRLFAKKSLEVRGLPFELYQPNERLQEAIRSDDYVTFDSSEDAWEYLNSDE
ncbi:type II toxin-antitoxin system RelB/DinJ family antitoxin [Fructobacillus tropaeoli]|uniref:DNA-damage-inducible protein n=1 Tax=Fructobacillus tropaeoli TaxID=709323 RepID=A0A3F3H4F3_9LACO|nr:type II toxin-antitoxin system RelB/DinJ family antitoxin [Fructobacillus tropaeoli]GAP05086.1 DNA-damage-inducible protein [Fructobacillus tropaeoli]